MYIHIDLDCFFVSCERIKYPFLHDKPVVVVNSADNTIFLDKKLKEVSHNEKVSSFMPNLVYDKFNAKDFIYANMPHTSLKKGCSCSFCDFAKKRFFDEKSQSFRGIVVAKSYDAKALGIATGTKLEEAFSLCENLIALPQDYLFYYEKSNELKNYLQTQIPVLEQFSIDEFFGDVSGWVEENEIEAFIEFLQNDILQKLRLPVSIGASSGKWIAKLATNFAKPYGVKTVFEDQIEDFIDSVAIEKFPGIGRAYAKKLRSRGIYTLGQTKRVQALFDSWGKHGKELYARIHGYNETFVKRSNSRQSVGISRVFATVCSKAQVHKRASVLASHLAFTVTKMGLTPTSFYFKIKCSNAPSYKKTIRLYRNFNEKFYKKLCKEVVDELLPHDLRVYAIALSVSNFTQNKPKTLSLLHHDEDITAQKIENSIKAIREKHGLSAIGYAL
jgi:DNA polymerase-4